MDWDKLRIFHSVAESGSLTNAGKTLNLSQSSVSRQITTLEESIGVALFRRHARGLVLTEQGELLHQATRDVYQKLAGIKNQLIDTQRRPEGPMTVTVSEFIASTWLAPKLAEFRERYPTIQLTVLVDDRILNINMKEADAAIRLRKATEPDLVQRHLSTIRFHICGSKKYFEKHGYPETVTDLKDHFLIAYPENITGPLKNPNWLFDVTGVDPKTQNNLMMVNSMYGIYRSVKTGAGIAALPDYLINEDPDLEVILPRIERPPIDMYFIYAEERRNSRRLIVFRDFLIENIKATPLSIPSA